MGEVKYFTAQSPEKLLKKMAKIEKISTMSDKVSGKQFIIRKSVVLRIVVIRVALPFCFSFYLFFQTIIALFFSYFLIPLIFYFDFSKFWHFLFFRTLKKQNAKFCFLFDYVLPVSRATYSCATIRLPRRRAYSRTLRRLAEIFKAACPAFERSQAASKKTASPETGNRPYFYSRTYQDLTTACSSIFCWRSFQSFAKSFLNHFLRFLFRPPFSCCVGVFHFFIASVFILLHFKIFVNQFSIVEKIFSANMAKQAIYSKVFAQRASEFSVRAAHGADDTRPSGMKPNTKLFSFAQTFLGINRLLCLCLFLTVVFSSYFLSACIVTTITQNYHFTNRFIFTYRTHQRFF